MYDFRHNEDAYHVGQDDGGDGIYIESHWAANIFIIVFICLWVGTLFLFYK